MRKLLASLLACSILGAPAPSFGQQLLLGVGKPSAAAPSLPCDVTACQAAYSVRKVRAAYSGNALQLRRASDSTTQNIGFSGGDLDTASAATFCASTTCTVATWYDQSGNGLDVAQTNATAQPAYNTSIFGSVPSLGFNTPANQNHLKNAVAVATGDWTVIAAFKPVFTSGLIFCIIGAQVSTTPCLFGGGTYQSGSVGVFDGSGQIHTTATVTTNTGYIYQATRATNAFTTSLSGGTAASGTLTGFGLTSMFIGIDGGLDGSFEYQGYIPEVLIFNNVLSGGNATTIRTNQGTYFGISTS